MLRKSLKEPSKYYLRRNATLACAVIVVGAFSMGVCGRSIEAVRFIMAQAVALFIVLAYPQEVTGWRALA